MTSAKEGLWVKIKKKCCIEYTCQELDSCSKL